MNSIILILVMAITVEGLVEYIKSVIVEDKSTKIIQLSALVASVLLCVASDADIYNFLGVEFILPVIGTILTGIFVSRGTNYISDLITRLQHVRAA